MSDNGLSNGVVLDLAFNPTPTFAVVWNNQLQAIRFSKMDEAHLHLLGLRDRENKLYEKNIKLNDKEAAA